MSRAASEKYTLGVHSLDLRTLADTPTTLFLPLTLSDGSISNSEVLPLPLGLSLTPLLLVGG
jgi:hypothetical protein